MTIQEVKQLHNGDEVFWNDPDEGKCSRHITIKHISIWGDDVVKITGEHGYCLECYAHELS